MVAKFGDWFSYENTPRAKIFRRDHSRVKDVESMTRLMRFIVMLLTCDFIFYTPFFIL